MAYTTARDETSVVVAMPPTIPTMRMMGTSSAGNARAVIFTRSGQVILAHRGQFSFRARWKMMTMMQKPSNAAGTTPATKKVATESVVIEATTIMTRLGGRVL